MTLVKCQCGFNFPDGFSRSEEARIERAQRDLPQGGARIREAPSNSHHSVEND